jgi:hypothetical protein
MIKNVLYHMMNPFFTIVYVGCRLFACAGAIGFVGFMLIPHGQIPVLPKVALGLSAIVFYALAWGYRKILWTVTPPRMKGA